MKRLREKREHLCVYIVPLNLLHFKSKSSMPCEPYKNEFRLTTAAIKAESGAHKIDWMREYDPECGCLQTDLHICYFLIKIQYFPLFFKLNSFFKEFMGGEKNPRIL